MNNPIFRWYRSALRHPQYRWWIILGTAAYLFSPIDISPDLVPLVGQIDDAAIVVLLISELYQIFTEWAQARREIAAPSRNAAETDTSQSQTSQSQTSQSQTSQSQTIDVDAVSID